MDVTIPDGRQMRVRGPDASAYRPFAHMVWVFDGPSSTRFHLGLAGSEELASANEGSIVRTGARSVRHGSGRISSLVRRDGMTVFMWRGRTHEITTAVHGTDVSVAAFRRLLAPLAVDDTPTGLVVRARRGSTASVSWVLGATTKFGEYFVSVADARVSARSVPKHAGLAVPGGELWRMRDADGPDTAVLASDSVLAEFTPGGGRSLDALTGAVTTTTFALVA